MEGLVPAFADKSVQTHYSSALNKIKAVLRSNQKDKLEILSGNIRMQWPDRFTNNFDYLTILQKAISSRNIVDLQYKNNNNEVSRRLVEPFQNETKSYRRENSN